MVQWKERPVAQLSSMRLTFSLLSATCCNNHKPACLRSTRRCLLRFRISIPIVFYTRCTFLLYVLFRCGHCSTTLKIPTRLCTLNYLPLPIVHHLLTRPLRTWSCQRGYTAQVTCLVDHRSSRSYPCSQLPINSIRAGM